MRAYRICVHWTTEHKVRIVRKLVSVLGFYQLLWYKHSHTKSVTTNSDKQIFVPLSSQFELGIVRACVFFRSERVNLFECTHQNVLRTKINGSENRSQTEAPVLFFIWFRFKMCSCDICLAYQRRKRDNITRYKSNEQVPSLLKWELSTCLSTVRQLQF